MKKVFFFVGFLLIAFAAQTQTWQPLGADNRDELGFGFSNLLWLEHDGDTVYAALAYYQTSTTVKNKLVIKKLIGSGWDTVGFSFSTYAVNKTSAFAINFDRFHTPYVFYPDSSVGYKGSVKKCVNGNWNQVGIPGFTNVPISSVSLKTGKADTPYVLFVDSGKISVMKFNGIAWDSVGNKRFATVSGVPGIGFDTTGVPYVAFSDPANLNRAVVMKFNGSIWTVISPFGGLSTLGAGGYTLKVDSTSNHLYVKFNDTAYRATVKKHDGISWQSVGAQGFTTAWADDFYLNKAGVSFLSLRRGDSAWVVQYDSNSWTPITSVVKKISSSFLTMAHDTIPVLGYYFSSYGSKPVVSKYINLNWTKLGPYGFVEGGVPKYSAPPFGNTMNLLRTTVTSSNVPYVVFSDSAFNGKLSMMKYTSGNWTYEGSPGFTTGFAYPMQFEAAKGDTLYLMYTETGTSGLKLARYNGNSFVNITSDLSSQTYPSGTAFALDTSGIPHVIYPDPTNFNLTTLKKFVNGTWTVLGSLPCTTAVQMKINRQNEVYAMYNSGTGSSVVSNLVKLTGNQWISITQSPLQGLMKIAPNDSVFLFALQLFSQTGPGGQIPITYYWYERRIYELTSNSWNSIGTFYATALVASTPPSLTEFYVNLIFDTNSIPYPVVISGDVPSIKAFANGWVNINTSTTGWHSEIRTPNFDMAFGPDNKLVAVYSQGTAYALSFQATQPPAAPQVVSPALYCQGDIASPLVATGQNVLWTGPGISSPSASPPVPSTAVPGTFNWIAYSTSGIYKSSNSIATVIVYPKPALIAVSDTICTGDTAYLSTPSVTGATYHWARMQMISGNPVVVSFDSTNTIAVTDSGSYTVTVSTTGCISDTLSVTILTPEYPSISITAPANAPIGQAVTVTATIVNAGSGYSIRWFRNGLLIATTFSDSLSFIKQPGLDSITAVVYKAGSPCYFPDTSNALMIDGVTSVQEVNTNNISVYPNPFEDIITVKGLKRNDLTQLLDITGRVIRTWKGETQVQALDAGSLVSGWYVLRVVNEEGVVKVNVPLVKH